MQKVNSFMILLGCLWLTACSTVPESLRVENDKNLVGYEKAIQNVNAVQGKQARWGGEIVAVKNGKDTTMLELIYFKNYASSKPIPSDDSLGRFRVYINKFVEPGIYKKGRLVSALGKIKGLESTKIGERDIKLPVLEQATIYLWPKEKDNKWKSRWDDPFWPYNNHWYWQRYHRLHPYYIPAPQKRNNKNTNKK
ncbi:Slp family lipoprotein [Gayadomonas joobiniege]|uniref:Slp family lipoprotein n=1 Tax=Gayadomonas joobiniege TaxID=1234606 RepID=UPI00037AC4B5|nr:Slp family lipoprotein [Gayadomonas joobiniege]